METCPGCCLPLAKMLTTQEQLMEVSDCTFQEIDFFCYFDFCIIENYFPDGFFSNNEHVQI